MCLSGFGQARPRCFGEDGFRILQGAGSANDPAFGHRDFDVVITVAHVKLPVAHILIGLPAVDIVVDGHLRIPVGQVEHLAVLAHARRAPFRYLEAPCEREFGGAAGRERLGQDDLHERPARAVAGLASGGAFLQHLAAGLDLRNLHAAGDGHESVPHRILFVEVLTQVDQHEAKLVGRVVVVADGFGPVEHLGFRRQRHLNGVVCRVGPVGGAGFAGGGAGSLLDGPLELRRRHHRVGNRAARLRRGIERDGQQNDEQGEDEALNHGEDLSMVEQVLARTPAGGPGTSQIGRKRSWVVSTAPAPTMFSAFRIRVR